MGLAPPLTSCAIQGQVTSPLGSSICSSVKLLRVTSTLKGENTHGQLSIRAGTS